MRVLIGLLILVLTTIFLAGCASTGALERVDVPVPVFCNPPAVEPPSRPIDALPEGADNFEFSRGLWATVETLEGYVAHLEAAINACRKPR